MRWEAKRELFEQRIPRGLAERHFVHQAAPRNVARVLELDMRQQTLAQRGAKTVGGNDKIGRMRGAIIEGHDGTTRLALDGNHVSPRSIATQLEGCAQHLIHLAPRRQRLRHFSLREH